MPAPVSGEDHRNAQPLGCSTCARFSPVVLLREHGARSNRGDNISKRQYDALVMRRFIRRGLRIALLMLAGLAAMPSESYACSPRSKILVFFHPDTDKLKWDDAIKGEIGNMNPACFAWSLVTHLDGPEAEKQGGALEERRAQVIASKLAELGHRDVRRIDYLGATRIMVVRPPGVADYQNSRIEIVWEYAAGVKRVPYPDYDYTDTKPVSTCGPPFRLVAADGSNCYRDER
jgi:hypothetical protein